MATLCLFSSPTMTTYCNYSMNMHDMISSIFTAWFDGIGLQTEFLWPCWPFMPNNISGCLRQSLLYVLQMTQTTSILTKVTPPGPECIYEILTSAFILQTYLVSHKKLLLINSSDSDSDSISHTYILSHILSTYIHIY